MASNLPNNHNIMPGVIGNNVLQQQQQQQQQQQHLLNSLTSSAADLEPMNIDSAGGMIQHNSIQNATSPSPNIGNLQSVVGTSVTTSSAQSPLAAVLNVSTPSPATSSILGTNKPSTPLQNDTYPQVLTRPRLQDLVREVDPTEQLDEDVEEVLLLIADDFVESTVEAACLLAKHRKAPTIEVKDVHFYLERHWCMWIPGFGTEELRPYKRAPVTEAHKQRLALIRKALKKY